MSPASSCCHPLASFTSRLESIDSTMSTIRFVSNWPQPSLNGTHMMMLGEL